MEDLIPQSKQRWRRILLSALLFLCTLPLRAEPQNGRIITITAGAAIRLILNPSTARAVQANSMLIQALHGGSGLIYILNCDPSITCVRGNAGTTLVAELAPATSTAPGGSFTFPTNGSATSGSGGFDVRYWAVDGSTNGDTVATSWDLRN